MPGLAVITQEAQFMVSQYRICDQYLILHDIARTLRHRLPAGQVHWDITVISHKYGLIRMIGYQPDA